MIEKDFDNVTKQKYLSYQFYFLRRVREIFFIPIKRCRKLNHELRLMWFRMKNRGKGFIFFLNLSLNWSKLKNVTIQRENNISDTQSKHHPNFVWHLLCRGVSTCVPYHQKYHLKSRVSQFYWQLSIKV